MSAHFLPAGRQSFARTLDVGRLYLRPTSHVLRPTELVVILFIAFSVILVATATAAPSLTVREERSREILQEDKDLRAKIAEGEKVFIEKIVIKGASAVSREQLDEATLPFQKRWLAQRDIEGLEDAVRQLYLGKGYKENPPEIFSQVSQNILEITIKEQ